MTLFLLPPGSAMSVMMGGQVVAIGSQRSGLPSMCASVPPTHQVAADMHVVSFEVVPRLTLLPPRLSHSVFCVPLGSQKSYWQSHCFAVPVITKQGLPLQTP